MFRKLARDILPPIVARAFKRDSPCQSECAVTARELKRLCELPEGQPATAQIFGRPFQVLDGRSFVHLYEIYFHKELYRFKTPTESPYIIDCGANIGIGVMWWKKKYPNARVLAFEADPEIFQILSQNCGHLKNVQLVNAAVWKKEGELPFSAKGGEGGHLAEFSPTTGEVIRSVPCVRLRSFLAEKCDFLKMDIEGAEIEVIRDCGDALNNVARAFVEYHSFIGRPQLLGQTISILEHAGFRLHIHTELPSPRPFTEMVVLNDKDLRLDLFCYREGTSPVFVPWGQEVSSTS